MLNDLVPSDPGEFLFYQTEDGRTRLQVRMEGETVWLSQKAMADLFQKDVRTISEHVRDIFEDGELRPEADNKAYDTQHDNLDVIISVGYRVKSLRGTQFRIWATQRLRELIVKGFTMDDERLKQAWPGWLLPSSSGIFGARGLIDETHLRPSQQRGLSAIAGAESGGGDHSRQ
jgi:hypothetical protein